MITVENRLVGRKVVVFESGNEQVTNQDFSLDDITIAILMGGRGMLKLSEFAIERVKYTPASESQFYISREDGIPFELLGMIVVPTKFQRAVLSEPLHSQGDADDMVPVNVFINPDHVNYVTIVHDQRVKPKLQQIGTLVSSATMETIIEMARVIQNLQDFPDQYDGELEFDSRELNVLIHVWSKEFELANPVFYLDCDNPHKKYEDGYYDAVDRFVRHKLERHYGITCFTPEWCHHCDSEVELLAVMKSQKCPSCGEKLFPCTLCTDKLEWRDCANCPFSPSVEVSKA
jgi:predicted RNA-binding Zn-ribbon protein involved in translation (DUF1610 family)